MKQIIILISLSCATLNSVAQANFVKNPGFEDTVKCPDEINEIGRARYWNCAVDTAGDIDGNQYYAPEYYNAICPPPNFNLSVPANNRFYQHPHSGNAMVAATLYYDKTSPPPRRSFFYLARLFPGPPAQNTASG